ncbi:endonuclease V [Dactylosporangium sp. NPDC051541]|uniref:endonuclease V n=1 Tax=Dactylosporangium sp. NPDC051541 TaxID=3363977 RepID=UPI0037A062FB
MIRAGAVDVDYPGSGGGRAALVVGDLPGFTVAAEHVAWLGTVEEYQPGSFYKRELPAIRAVLDGVEPVELLIVDGYVDLDPDGRPGLGAHVAAALGIPVIGVAKTAFRAAVHAVPVLRGAASKPLYVTATGLSRDDAAAYVRGMRGAYRMPDALRQVDALARGRARPRVA